MSQSLLDCGGTGPERTMRLGQCVGLATHLDPHVHGSVVLLLKVSGPSAVARPIPNRIVDAVDAESWSVAGAPRPLAERLKVLPRGVHSSRPAINLKDARIVDRRSRSNAAPDAPKTVALERFDGLGFSTLASAASGRALPKIGSADDPLLAAVTKGGPA